MFEQTIAAVTGKSEIARIRVTSRSVFRNDLTPERALEPVCTTEGEVDIVTGVEPAMAERVKGSACAKLVADDAIRSFVGIFNRNAPDLPLGSIAARQALNHAIGRDAIVKEALYGYFGAAPLREQA